MGQKKGIYHRRASYIKKLAVEDVVGHRRWRVRSWIKPRPKTSNYVNGYDGTAFKPMVLGQLKRLAFSLEQLTMTFEDDPKLIPHIDWQTTEHPYKMSIKTMTVHGITSHRDLIRQLENHNNVLPDLPDFSVSPLNAFRAALEDSFLKSDIKCDSIEFTGLFKQL